MAKKIPFSVIFATDEDSAFPASELNGHGPTVLGWRSSANSKIQPQELILKFHRPAKVCRIQVLGHQFMIPERIELWLHNAPKDSPTTPSSQNFDYLGFIVLSDNSASQYKSRELQSVSVAPRMGSHLKLRMGTPYANDLNDARQVALIGINVLGMDSGEDAGPSGAPESITSICDCLSFSMYVEETICEVVKELEAKKSRAVVEERFEYARKLKLCMGALRSAGERLGRYALAKRQAVAQEDFSTARLRKEQIELYRNSVFSQLEVCKLLEKSGPVTENDLVSPVYISKPVLPSPPSLQEVAHLLLNDPKEQHSPKPPSQKSEKQDEPYFSPQLSKIGRSPSRNSPTNTGSLRRRNKSAPRNSYEDYEERTLPTLRTECQSTLEVEANSRGRFKVMNDRERRQAALPLLVFGTELVSVFSKNPLKNAHESKSSQVEMFYSKQFQDREEGLVRLRNILKNPTVIEGSIGPNKVARSSTLLLYRAVRDAVFSVFSQAAETVRALFVDFIPQRISANEVSRCVDRLLPELLAKSGDPSPRIHTLAQHTILSIASCTEVRQQNLVAPALSRPVGSGTHPRLALSRIQMLEQLVLSQGISTDKQSGLTCRSLTECGCSGIHHPSEPVRKVAERVLLQVYRINPRLIRKQLPPDDDITRRNLLYRQLFTEFDKIDKARRSEMLEPMRDDQVDEEEGAAFGDAWDVEELKVSLPSMANGEKNGCKQTVQCSFCDWVCEKDSGQLDKHYWKSCPLLMKCPQCQCVLEVSAYSHHLTNECEAKESYVICKRCSEAVHMELFQLHLLEEYCREVPPSSVRCPLCHENIPENGWKEHFLDQALFCRGNSRRHGGKK
ncbi:centrosomal protein of 104 kDa isoform X2 [Phlebotomus argentipes]|uniref:centrosomal protein of 104 kDa isoform X2 n=1 Tax=Phlebotomus argentipes TaxID=94469 RepID=UPI0028935FD5|nr:centrosomal protein of 104 kDa isoform X2 [Phlebotomus argentipes]